jgi:hypothetical protein
VSDGTQGQADEAGSTPADFAVNPDFSLVLLNKPPADGQAQAGPPFFGGEEGNEQELKVLRGNALAGVRPGDFLTRTSLLFLTSRMISCFKAL